MVSGAVSGGASEVAAGRRAADGTGPGSRGDRQRVPRVVSRPDDLLRPGVPSLGRERSASLAAVRDDRDRHPPRAPVARADHRQVRLRPD